MPKEGGEVSQRDALHELEEFARVPRLVRVGWLEGLEPKSKEIRVAEMTFDQCAYCGKHVRAIVEKLGTEIRVEDIPQLIVDHALSVRAIVAIAATETEAFVGNLPLDQFAALAQAVFEVNHGFFVLRVGPAWKALAFAIFGGPGPTLSTVSPSTGTPSGPP